VWGHVERALAVIDSRVIPGTALAAYGHGDWNDSLQPVDPSMRERLCSAWTVTLHHQMLATLATGLRAVGREALAAPIESRLPRIRADFQQHLLPDGVLTGFAYFPETGPTRYLVHPRDAETGMHYGLLAMIHALVNDVFTPDQAREHIALIKTHLLAPDGARLFDRPPPYQGGPQTYFQRAESSSFFGREIGVMYMHAHLRYAEAMARHGDAEAFFDALCRANPIALRSLVPHAAVRQANCYYSSSDAAFFDRYEASARYDEVNAGTVSVEGGWRVYSSGAGIATRLIHQRLLGLELRTAALFLDPVLPSALDGLEVEIVLWERPVTVVYRVGEIGSGPLNVMLNGAPLDFAREANPYRTGGILLDRAQFAEQLDICDNRLEVQLG
jgi:cellobiose phosphorylase